MRRISGLVLAAAVAVCAQGDLSGQFHHLCTFGSKMGIHPPRILNRKSAIAAMGKSEFPYGLGFPVAVATDARNRVWITDSATASIHVFDRASGAYQEIRRVADQQLVQPAGIAADAQGRIYAVDSGTGNIYVFDEKGEYDRSLVKRGHFLQKPTALALSEDGRTVYVADPPKNAVFALNREGEVNTTIQLPADFGEALSISTVDNQVYVLGARQHKVLMFSPAGRPRGERRWDAVPIPSAFAYDAIGRRFLLADPRLGVVQIFDESGRNLSVFGQLGEGVDQAQRIESMYIDPKGLVYLVASHEGKVLVFADGQIR